VSSHSYGQVQVVLVGVAAHQVDDLKGQHADEGVDADRTLRPSGGVLAVTYATADDVNSGDYAGC